MRFVITHIVWFVFDMIISLRLKIQSLSLLWSLCEKFRRSYENIVVEFLLQSWFWDIRNDSGLSDKARIFSEFWDLENVELPVWDPRSRERRSSLDVSWRLLPIPVLCQTNFHTHILHANKQNVFYQSRSFGYLKRTNAAKAYNYSWYDVIQSKASN